MAGAHNTDGAGTQGGEDAPLADNPSGFVKPGEGINDLAGKDHAFRRAAQRREQLDHREAAVSSGGFKLDVESIRELQTDWEDLTRELQDLAYKCARLGMANAPADEKASINQIKAVHEHAKICATIHEQMFQYSYQYATKLRDAVSQIEQSDHAARQSLNEVGRDL